MFFSYRVGFHRSSPSTLGNVRERSCKIEVEISSIKVGTWQQVQEVETI